MLTTDLSRSDICHLIDFICTGWLQTYSVSFCRHCSYFYYKLLYSIPCIKYKIMYIYIYIYIINFFESIILIIVVASWPLPVEQTDIWRQRQLGYIAYITLLWRNMQQLKIVINRAAKIINLNVLTTAVIWLGCSTPKLYGCRWSDLGVLIPNSTAVGDSLFAFAWWL